MPDHNDVTPSMILHLDTDRFHCFGCGASGDVIQWVRSIHGVGAGKAVRLLDTDGLLPEPPTGAVVDRHTAIAIRSAAERPELERTSPDRVKAALAAVWGYYTFASLHDEAVRYLRGIRGIDVDALEAEQGRPMVGHTPHKAPDQLVTRLREKGFSGDELVDAGLARRYPDGRVIDTYRDRTVLPVRDDFDAVVGLIGRYDGRLAPGKGGPPKYLNPTRTVTYDKSVNLCRPSVADTRGTAPLLPDAQVVLCEGTLDALAIAAMSASIGRSAEFAPVVESGIALSAAQWDAILAIHDRAPVICADGDPTGRVTSAKWAIEAARRGRESAITLWPEGHDPASYLAEHGAGGLAAVTRRVCTTAGADNLHPRCASPIVVAALATEAGVAGKSVADAVLDPLGTLTEQGPRARYAKAAARYLAGGVVTDAMATSNDPAEVAKAVAWYGVTRFPADTREEWSKAAAMQLDLAGYRSAARSVSGIMKTMRVTVGPPAPAPDLPTIVPLHNPAPAPASE
jgi:DNA primase